MKKSKQKEADKDSRLMDGDIAETKSEGSPESREQSKLGILIKEAGSQDQTTPGSLDKAPEEAKPETQDQTTPGSSDKASEEVKPETQDQTTPESSDKAPEEVKPETQDQTTPESSDKAPEEVKPETQDQTTPESSDKAPEEVEPETQDQTTPEFSDKASEEVEPETQDLTRPAAASEENGMEEGAQTPKKKRRLVKGICLGLAGAAALAAAGVYIGGAVYFQDKFLPNTVVNGTEVSKQTVEQVEKNIADRVRNYSFSLYERGNKKEKITADQIGYHYAPGGEVLGFKESQNPYKWPLSLWEEYHYKFEAASAYDKKKLKETLKNLECMKPENTVAPKDAYMKFDSKLYKIEEEVEGTQVNLKKLTRLASGLVLAGKKTGSLEKTGCYDKPQIRSDDERLVDLVEKLNKYCQTTIEYDFGESRETLDGSTIHQWVTFDEDGNVALDGEQVRSYVASLAEKYDTYDRPREFKTNDGSMVMVNGGHYGWLIDQEQETLDLTKLIELGAVQERVPDYAQTAASRENSDLGKDYVEIDLTKQHLWMYMDGRTAVSSDFVSGSMAKAGCATPGGTYTLYYRKSPAILKSSKPGDSYESRVTYWMPFNGGIGMHDANWRGSFGGNIYQYDGSHGCINLPTDVAGQIYEMIYEGFPIICFYR